MSIPMILYQVDVELKHEVVEAYAAWLNEHVAEILSLPGFLRAEVFEEPAAATAETRAFSVRFVLKNRESLESYLREHAQRMRSKGSELFEGGFTARRRVFVIHETHTPRIG